MGSTTSNPPEDQKFNEDQNLTDRAVNCLAFSALVTTAHHFVDLRLNCFKLFKDILINIQLDILKFNINDYCKAYA